MDASHALLKPRRIPRDIVVDHPPTELHVQALASGIGRDEDACPTIFVRLSEKVDLIVAFAKWHSTVDVSDASGESDLLEFREEKI
jgi:hypothetical protein